MTFYGGALEAFSDQMLKKLMEKQKVYGDSWRGCLLEILALKLVEEFSEIFATEVSSWRDTEKIRKELVDLANVCFLLWCRLGMEEDRK